MTPPNPDAFIPSAVSSDKANPSSPAPALRRDFLLLTLGLVALPLIAFGTVTLLGPSGNGRVWSAVLFALAAGAFVLYLFLMRRMLRIRLYDPLRQFRSTLEDIAEGFILDRFPEEGFRRAEPDIAGAFRQVVHINRMLLRNVDNLEQGYEEERQAKLAQQALTRAYQRFVPQDFIRFLQKTSITEIKLGDHVRTDMTILVSDIRSFTALSESMTPEENFNLINDYLYVMEPIVNENHGFIDKYMGDSVMALFHRSPDHAVRAALQMLERLRAFNARREETGKPAIRIGIGLNTGSMMLGIVGGENRMEGTVISDAVNLAARMEDLNKTYGTSILMSEFTYSLLEDPARYAVRKIDRVQVKGKSNAVDIYEVADIAEITEIAEVEENAWPDESRKAGEAL